jgi:hypothetical protein
MSAMAHHARWSVSASTAQMFPFLSCLAFLAPYLLVFLSKAASAFPHGLKVDSLDWGLYRSSMVRTSNPDEAFANDCMDEDFIEKKVKASSLQP